MTPGQIDQIANTIVKQLRENYMVPGRIPQNIADTILQWTHSYQFDFSFVLSLGPEGFIILIRLLTDGTINIKLTTMSRVTFWEADLRPA